MDEPQPTQNFFSPHDDQTALLGHAGPLPEAEPPSDHGEYYGSVPQPTAVHYAPPPEWPVPVWRRRGALIGAAAVVLAIAGVVAGIVIAAPSSTPTASNTAAVAPATSAQAASTGKGKGAGRVKLQPGESLLLGTVSSVTNGQLVVTPAKGGDPVTVTTNGTTRFAGGATSVTDLRQGERVQLIVKDGAAVAIRARKAATGG